MFLLPFLYSQYPQIVRSIHHEAITTLAESGVAGHVAYIYRVAKIGVVSLIKYLCHNALKFPDFSMRDQFSCMLLIEANLRNRRNRASASHLIRWGSMLRSLAQGLDAVICAGLDRAGTNRIPVISEVSCEDILQLSTET